VTYPKIWGHRGASGYAPENTLEAFSLAVEMGADGVELDVQLTKDEEIVVIHDETIDRVSNGKGWVKDYTLKELKTFNYNKTHPEYEFVTIPTLKEVYTLLKDTELCINVEVKAGVICYKGIEEKILKLSDQMGMQDRVLYSSFNHYSIRRIQVLNTNAQIGLLYTQGLTNVVEYGIKMGVNAIHPSMDSLKCPGLINLCKQNSLQTHVWNVRDEDISYCCEMGVDAIITNYPDRTARIINEYAGLTKQ